MSEWVGNPAPEELIAQRREPVTQLELRVLGPLIIRIGGVQVEHPELRRCRVRELVHALVVHREVRRDVLADLLWPDLPDPRHNLRVTLDYLRGAIEVHHAHGQPAGYVHADRRTITFDSNVQCDLWDLEAHLTRADEAEFAGDLTSALRFYDLALPLWTAAPFEEIGHLDWARNEQTRWCRRFGSAATRCAELHLTAGAFHHAIYAGERASRADPYDEQPYCITARAHLAGGNRQRARAALHDCLAALKDLGVPPSPSTAALHAEIGMPPATSLTIR